MKKILVLLTLSAFLAVPALSFAAAAGAENEQGTVNALKFTVTWLIGPNPPPVQAGRERIGLVRQVKVPV